MDKAYDPIPTLRSRALRRNPTPAERKLWLHLSNRQLGGVRFNRQVKVRPYICDFVARAPKLVIELDGGQHATQIEEDRRRTKFLEQRGYRVLRFWNNDVLENMDGVLTEIERVLKEMPPIAPSRNREGKRRDAPKGRACGEADGQALPQPLPLPGGEKG